MVLTLLHPPLLSVMALVRVTFLLGQYIVLLLLQSSLCVLSLIALAWAVIVGFLSFCLKQRFNLHVPNNNSYLQAG